MSRRTGTLTMDHSGERDAPAAAAEKAGRAIARPTAARAGLTLLDVMRKADGLPPRQVETGLRVPLAETLSRCKAAAYGVVPFDWDGGEAAAECAADVFTDLVWEARGETMQPDGQPLTDCPRVERTRMGYLRWRASDWMRRERTLRDRSADLEAEEAAGEPMSAALVTDSTPPGLPRRAAVIAAARLAAVLGHPATLGPLLYDCLRDGSGAEKAAEYGMGEAQYRKAISRGRAAIRRDYPHPLDLLRRLSLTDDPSAGGTMNPHSVAASRQWGEAIDTRRLAAMLAAGEEEDSIRRTDLSLAFCPPRAPMDDEARHTARQAARRERSHPHTAPRPGPGNPCGWRPADVPLEDRSALHARKALRAAVHAQDIGWRSESARQAGEAAAAGRYGSRALVAFLGGALADLN